MRKTIKASQFHYLLLHETFVDDFHANVWLVHGVNMRILFDYSSLLPGDLVEGVTEQLRMFQLQRGDADDFCISDDVGRIVFTANSYLNDGYIDVLFRENVKRHNLEEFEVRRQIVLVVFLDLQSIENLPKVVVEQLFTYWTASQFNPLRHWHQMRWSKQACCDVMLAQDCISVCTHWALALAAWHVNHWQFIERFHRKSVDSLEELFSVGQIEVCVIVFLLSQLNRLAELRWIGLKWIQSYDGILRKLGDKKLQFWHQTSTHLISSFIWASQAMTRRAERSLHSFQRFKHFCDWRHRSQHALNERNHRLIKLLLSFIAMLWTCEVL